MIVLDKLVAMRCHDQKLLEHLRELAGGDVYSLTLAEVERCAKGGVPDPLHREVVKLYQQVEERGLIELFRTGPDLSEVHPDDILTLASFSDVRPDAKTMFRTADAVFMRLVDLSKQGPVVVTKLILDDFCLLAVLAIYFPEAWESLRTLAEGPSWTADMLAVERFLSDRQTLPNYRPAALFAKTVAAGTMPDGGAVAAFVLAPPGLSGILAEEVLAYDVVCAQLPDPDSLIDKQYTPNPSALEKGASSPS